MAAATVTLPRAIAAPTGTRIALRLWPEWLTLSLYAALVASGIPFHEAWADEAQAWQMARALPAHDLLFHALRYEGTPALWHLLLRSLIVLHVNYVQMHWICGLIAACGMSLLIFFSPFPRWVRLTLPFTVFFAFQYAIVARSYVLVPLLTFAAVIFWKRNTIVLATFLGLLANTSLYGFALAAGLSVVYIVETRRGLHAPAHPRIALVILLALFGFAVFTALPPPPDLSFAHQAVHASLDTRLRTAPLMGLAYLLHAFSQSWLLSVLIAAAVLCLLHRLAGKLYLVPLLSVTVLSAVGYWNYWHLGFTEVALVATAWITWGSMKPAKKWPIYAVFTVWLTLQLSYTAYAFAWDRKNAYSPDQAAAQYLAHFVSQGLPLAVTTANNSEVGAFHSVGLAPYFDHPIFINQPRLYWLWSRNENTDAQFQAALDQNPAVIVAMFFTSNGHRFDRSRDLDLPHLQHLYQRGYRVTKVFCGEKPEGFKLREEICEVVLER